MRLLNLVIGLAVATGVALVLFGAVGGSGSSRGRGAEAPATGGGLPQLGAAAQVVGPTAPPPPFPETASLPPPPPPSDPLLARLVATPDRPPDELVDERWALVEARLAATLGRDVADDDRDALYAALVHWLQASGRALAAYHGGFIDRRALGQHLGWNRNAYLLAAEDALGNERFQRFAAGSDFGEVSPLR